MSEIPQTNMVYCVSLKRVTSNFPHVIKSHVSVYEILIQVYMRCPTAKDGLEVAHKPLTTSKVFRPHESGLLHAGCLCSSHLRARDGARCATDVITCP